MKQRTGFFTAGLTLLGLVSAWCLTTEPKPPRTPGADSGKIGFVVGKLLANNHYRKQALDDTVSQQFLKFYLEELDPSHRIFLASEVQEFEKKYAMILDDEMRRGNMQPGFDIFDRCVQRLEQLVVMLQEMLKEDYSFTEDDSVILDRKDAPWPANDEEYRKHWRQVVKYDLLHEKLNKKSLAEAREIVSRRYARMLRMYREEDADAVLQRYLTALAHAYDPHSDYMAPTEQKQFKISMQLSLVGIGAVLISEDGYAKVGAVVPGGPAYVDKRLKVNDRIAAVAQGDGNFVDIVDMKLSKAVELIRGEKNTEVRLLIIPAAATDPSTRTEIRLKRDEIKLAEAEAKAKVIERKDAHGRTVRLGYLDLPSFYSGSSFGLGNKSTTRDISRLIEKLKAEKIDGLILDLRHNGGGVLQEAIALTGLFIKNGPVVQVKNSDGRVSVLPDENPSVLYDGPLVVLVTHLSASASEILAAALQDYGRAVIVGDQGTFGKGTVQKVEEIGRYIPSMENAAENGGALKFTTQKFYRISGGSTQYRGVIPDIQLPSELDSLKINEASLKNALPYDNVAPAGYVPVNTVTPILPELRKRSQERVLRNPDYDYVREDIIRLKQRLDDKSVSLNETKRLQEKKGDADRVEKRKGERAARKSPSQQTTEITLDSLSGGSSGKPSLTRAVLEEARATMKEPGDESDSKDITYDPPLDEGGSILMDLVGILSKDSHPTTTTEPVAGLNETDPVSRAAIQNEVPAAAH